MLNIYKGKAGSGKTITLVNTLMSHRTDNNLVIVNPQSIEFYENLCAEQHISADVVSIYDIFEYLSDIIGAHGKTLSLTEKNILIAMIISNGNYSYVPTEYSFSGLVDKITMAISDLKKQHISVDQFKSWVDTMRFTGDFYKKSAELANIWTKYEEECSSNGYIDNDSLSWNVIERLNSLAEHVADYVYIDTLQEYTVPIIELIKAIAVKCKDCYTAFRLTDGGTADSVAFSDATSAVEKLSASVDNETIIKVNSIGAKPVKSNIESIARNFFSYHPETVSPDGSVDVLELPSPIDEVKMVCSEIIKMHKNGERYEDIAVAAPSMESYYPALKQIFDDNNVPFHFFKTNRLAGTQIYNYLISYIEFDDKATESYVNVVNAGVSPATHSEKELISGIFDRFGPDADFAMKNCATYDTEAYAAVSGTMRKIKATANELHNNLSECKTFGEYIETIYGFISHNDVIESKILGDALNLEDAYEYHTRNDVVLAWNAMTEVFDVFMEIVGNKSIDFSTFINIFKKACEDKKIVNNIRFFDEVAVTGLSEVVDTRKNVLFAIGCTDTGLAMVPERSYYQEEEKMIINRAFDIALPSLDYYVGKKIATVYSALTSPYNKLIISMPEIDESFTPTSKASILHSIYAMFKSADKTVNSPDYISDVNFEHFLCELSDCLHTTGKMDEKCEENFFVYMFDPIYGSRLSNFLECYNKSLDRYNTSEKFASAGRIGVTTAQKFNECPFKAYTDLFLHPRTAKLFEENAANIGTFYHSVFYNVYTDMKNADLTASQLLEDETLFKKVFEEAVEKSATGHNENILNSTEKNKFLKKRLIETAYMSVRYSLLQVDAGEYTPTFFEYKANGSVIDRVDLSNDGYARVIDYKSSETVLDTDLVEAGVRIQLPMYMSYLKDYKFGGAYYFRVHKAKSKGERDENELLKDYRLSGLTNETAVTKADKSLAEVPANSNIVSIRTTSKGEFYKNSAVISETAWNDIERTAEEKYTEACNGLKENRNEAAPYHTATYNSCTYCPYSGLCHRAVASDLNRKLS